MKTIWMLITIETVDILTTWFAISKGGVELNPIVTLLGWFWVIVLKILFTILVAIAFRNHLPAWVQYIVLAGISIPVINNLIQILRSIL